MFATEQLGNIEANPYCCGFALIIFRKSKTNKKSIGWQQLGLRALSHTKRRKMNFLKRFLAKSASQRAPAQSNGENTVLRDNSVLVFGMNTREAAEVFKSQGVPNVKECYYSNKISELTRQDGKVKVLTLCFTHNIPLGVIAFQEWYDKVLRSANLNPSGINPEIKINFATSDKKGMILLHWDETDMQTLLSTTKALEGSLQKWS